MTRQKVLKIVGIVGCMILSIFFILSFVAVPFYYSITALTKPETIVMIFQEVDYKSMVEKTPELKLELQKYDISSNKAQKIMESKQAGDVIELYIDEFTEILLDVPSDIKLDVPYLKGLVNDNLDELLNIAEENTKLKFKKEQVQQNINNYFDKNQKSIEKSMPVMESVRNVVKTVHTSKLVQRSLTPLFAVVLVAVAFVVLGAIIAIRRSNGFLWIGIDFAVISIILCLVMGYSQSNFINRLAFNLSDFGTQVIKSAVSVSTNKLLIAIFAAIILTILFAGFFVLLKLLKRKYQSTVGYVDLPVITEETEITEETVEEKEIE